MVKVNSFLIVTRWGKTNTISGIPMRRTISSPKTSFTENPPSPSKFDPNGHTRTLSGFPPQAHIPCRNMESEPVNGLSPQ